MISIEEFPSEEFLAQYDPPIHPTEILGYFSGPTLMERSLENPWSQFPAKVVIFRKNIEKHAHNEQDLVEEMRITLLHELGHYLGLDEADLEERGLN